MGRVVPAKAGDLMPQQIAVHLVPSDAEVANDILHYASIWTDANQQFTISHIPPGNYWLLPLADKSRNQAPISSPPLFFDPSARQKLRQLAAQRGILLSLPKDCRIDQFEVPMTAP
jgi:hypothetical protein